MASNDEVDEDGYKQLTADVFPTKFYPGSIVDQTLIRGRNEGREEGLSEGRRSAKIDTVQLLEELLGDSISPTESLQEQTLDQLSETISAMKQRLRDRQA